MNCLGGDSNVIASGIFGMACSSLIYKMRRDKQIEIDKLYREIRLGVYKEIKEINCFYNYKNTNVNIYKCNIVHL